VFKTSILYLENLNSTASVVVNQGGTSSGKTYSILQVLFSIAISEEKKTITVVGQDMPNLKVGAIRDALSIVDSSDELKSLLAKPFNNSDKVFTFKTGSIIEFKSYDNSQDAKSGKRDYLFMNEANGITFDVYSELVLRTRQKTFLDYNPNIKFWVHQKLIGREGVQLIISDHRHNPFIEDVQRRKIEALKDIDLDLWKVYARGMTGKIEGLVFRNWHLCEHIPSEAKLIGIGLDFGFTNDPTACVEVYMSNGELWVNELVYETGLTNQDIAKKFSELGLKGKPIVADSAEPKSIEELRRAGWYVDPAKKGADSINISISGLKNYRINITSRSTNLRKEFSSYKWKVDRATGNPMNEPVDFLNHGIDALRYCWLNFINQNNKKPITNLVSKGY